MVKLGLLARSALGRTAPSLSSALSWKQLRRLWILTSQVCQLWIIRSRVKKMSTNKTFWKSFSPTWRVSTLMLFQKSHPLFGCAALGFLVTTLQLSTRNLPVRSTGCVLLRPVFEDTVRKFLTGTVEPKTLYIIYFIHIIITIIYSSLNIAKVHNQKLNHQRKVYLSIYWILHLFILLL